PASLSILYWTLRRTASTAGPLTGGGLGGPAIFIEAFHHDCGRRRNRSCPDAQDRSETEDDRSRHLSGAWPAAAAEGEARTREGTLLGPALLSKQDRKSTRLNSSHVKISYAVFCLKKKSHRQADME